MSNSENAAPAAAGKSDIRRVRTFYPGSLDRAEAVAIDLTGEELPGIDIRIRAVQTFHIRGKLAGETMEDTGLSSKVMLWDSDALLPRMIAVAKDRTFDIEGLTPGSYSISAGASKGQEMSMRQAVEVGSADVNKVVLTTRAPFALHGSIQLQGSSLSSGSKQSTLENVVIILGFVNQGGMTVNSARAITNGDGSFVMEDVIPGKLQIRVLNKPEGCYLKSIRLDYQEVSGNTLDLTESSGAELQLVLGTDAAAASGTVLTKQATPAKSSCILLIPEDLTRHGGSVHAASADESGVFRVSGIAPGTYYAVA
jgi:hypothetical protein